MCLIILLGWKECNSPFYKHVFESTDLLKPKIIELSKRLTTFESDVLNQKDEFLQTINPDGTTFVDDTKIYFKHSGDNYFFEYLVGVNIMLFITKNHHLIIISFQTVIHLLAGINFTKNANNNPGVYARILSIQNLKTREE